MALALLALLLVALPDPGPVLPDTAHVFDLRLTGQLGQRADGAELADVRRAGVWLHWRTGRHADTATLSGGSWGPDAAVALGWTMAGDLQRAVTGEEGGFGGDGGPALVARVGAAGRMTTWNTPFASSLVLHGGPELALGDRTWWGGGARLAFLAGLRVLFGHGGPLRGTLEYAVVPLTFGWAPDGVEVQRLEHRGRLALVLGRFGLGATAAVGQVHALRAGAGWRSVRDLTVGAFAELRLPDEAP